MWPPSANDRGYAELQKVGVYSKLTAIFQDVFEDETLVVNPTLSADDVPGWDSLRNIRLILAVERSYGIKLTASEIGKLQNVGDLARLVASKL